MDLSRYGEYERTKEPRQCVARPRCHHQQGRRLRLVVSFLILKFKYLKFRAGVLIYFERVERVERYATVFFVFVGVVVEPQYGCPLVLIK